MIYHNQSNLMETMFWERPKAVAQIKGSLAYPQIKGMAQFYQTGRGTVVVVEVQGLPHAEKLCRENIFAVHIHEGINCSGNDADPFADAMMHYNPGGCEHPYHAGDMPPLFENHGMAFLAFLTDRFRADEIIGKTIIVHDKADDFTTQPSGNVGAKIACGEIVSV